MTIQRQSQPPTSVARSYLLDLRAGTGFQARAKRPLHSSQDVSIQPNRSVRVETHLELPPIASENV